MHFLFTFCSLILKRLFRIKIRKCKEKKEEPQDNDVEEVAIAIDEGEEWEDEERREAKKRGVSNPRRWSYASRREGSKAPASVTPDEEVERLVSGFMQSMQSGCVARILILLLYVFCDISRCNAFVLRVA